MPESAPRNGQFRRRGRENGRPRICCRELCTDKCRADHGERIVLDGYLAGPVNGFRATLGLPPVKRVFGAWRHSPDLVLGLFPAWFGSARDWPPHFHQTGFVRYDQGEDKQLSPEVEQNHDTGHKGAALIIDVTSLSGTTVRGMVRFAPKSG